MTSSGVSKIMGTMTLARGSEVGEAAEKSNEFDLMLSRKTANADGMMPEQAETSREGLGQQIAPVVSKETDVIQAKQSYEKGKSSTALDRIPKASDRQTEKTMTAETEKAYEDWKEKVTEVLKEELEVTEEELAEAMAALGITFEDLLAGNGLLQLSMELTGTTEISDLLFDGNFQELMQEVNTFIDQLTEQVDMTPEELQMMLKEALEGVDEPEELPKAPVEEPIAELGQIKQEMPPENPVVSAAELLQRPSTELSDSKNVQTAEEPVDSQEIQNVVTSRQEIGGDAQKEAELSQDDQKDQKELGNQGKEGTREITKQMPDNGHETQQMNFHTTVQNTVTNLGEGVVQTVERIVNVQDVINQISEFTRVTVTQDVSRLEMQLNPEHLGKLYMQLTSREGVITAQLIAQNEAVKQALESQVNVLKENMNEQGMKVEAVEVTVASHEFEEQFREDQQMDQQQEQAANHRPRRFLNADQLDEFAGQLSEEDSLAAKIMVENGNSVDMTA